MCVRLCFSQKKKHFHKQFSIPEALDATLLFQQNNHPTAILNEATSAAAATVSDFLPAFKGKHCVDTLEDAVDAALSANKDRWGVWGPPLPRERGSRLSFTATMEHVLAALLPLFTLAEGVGLRLQRHHILSGSYWWNCRGLPLLQPMLHWQPPCIRGGPVDLGGWQMHHSNRKSEAATCTNPTGTFQAVFLLQPINDCCIIRTLHEVFVTKPIKSRCINVSSNE